jgi:uridine phosphorylase
MGASSMSVVVNELIQVGVREIVRVRTHTFTSASPLRPIPSTRAKERSQSANPHLLRRLRGITEEYQHLKVLNYEMEAGTLFKMGAVYGFAAGCVCGVVAQRTPASGSSWSRRLAPWSARSR